MKNNRVGTYWNWLQPGCAVELHSGVPIGPSEMCQFIAGSVRGSPASVDWEYTGSEW